MTNLSPEAQRLLALQHGVASIDQLHAAGHTTRQIERLENQHQLKLVVRGAYRSPIAPFDELSRCTAICLARPNVVISSATAGRIWGFRHLPRDARVHIIGPRASNPARAPWLVTYHTDAIHTEDVVTRADGIRVTGRVRTAFDLSRTLSAEDLLSVIEQAVHDGRATEDELWAVAADWVSPRRPWIQHYLRQVVRRFPGGAAESHPEVVVAEMLRDAGVGGLVRQCRVYLPGYGLARFDLAVPPTRVAIEVDVHPDHDTTRGRRSDERRDEAAVAQGWQTIRIRSDQYANHLTDTIGHIADLVRQRASSLVA